MNPPIAFTGPSPLPKLISTHPHVSPSICVISPPHRPQQKRPRSAATSPQPSPPSPSQSHSLEDLVQKITALSTSRGALGRGTRACLLAFARRGRHLTTVHLSTPSTSIYLEIGPAYVLSTSRKTPLPNTQPPTRYAVEQRAWPTLRALVRWEEVPTTEARHRGALLRRLRGGARFGRHLFLPASALHALVRAADILLSAQALPETQPPSARNVEAIVHLRRLPLPGLRTVSARCPRRIEHAHADRKPSLMLWMNSDGVTGGAMCPVCVERSGETPGRQVTWRVHYLPDNVAVLCTPMRRVPSPRRVLQELTEWRREDDADVPQGELGEADLRKERHVMRKGAVGGCVLRDREKLARVGNVIGMAYVTASLRILTHANTMGEVSLDGTRTRTVGTMARQKCPVQVLLWSDRRSKGPTSAKRVEDVAWYARQAVGLDGADGGAGPDAEEDTLESEEWLPTPLVSVSAMKPSGWRDVTSANGRLISVPASWEASVQAWVLFDIDDIELLDGEDVVTESANKMALAVRRNRELSGRCLVMQTGPTGLHVWAELREVREDPRAWFKKEEVRSWYAELGTRLLQASHRAGSASGKIDMSSCSAGRFARRPGWRLLDDGTLFRSRVVMYVPSIVRKRMPRQF